MTIDGISIDSACITDVGKKRKGNEDAFFYDDDKLLYVVADGMGGHKAGEVASRIVVDTNSFGFLPDDDVVLEDDQALARIVWSHLMMMCRRNPSAC